MKNIILELEKAKKINYSNWNDNFVLLINNLILNDNLKTDWDLGENWAIFRLKSNNVILFMISGDLPMMFLNNSYSQQLQSLFNNIPIHKIYVNTFIKEEWYVDKIKLEKNFPEIQLIVSNDAINLNEFSLLNLYFATIYS